MIDSISKDVVNKEIINKGLTVRQLHDACVELIEKGQGDRYVLISQDDEGNGYHRLFFLFTPHESYTWEHLRFCNIPRDIDKDTYNREYILLG